MGLGPPARGRGGATEVRHNIITGLGRAVYRATLFVRVKTVRGRRFAYVVEGKRTGADVRQKVVRYLGPMSRLANGVPEAVATRGGTAVDWKMVNDALRRIPLTFDELDEARRSRFSRATEARRQGFLRRSTRRRLEGEEEALFRIAASKFGLLFREVGKGRYRMR